jgi:2'-5' RNA ligase
MRLFTGIDLPEDVRERLERLLMHLRPAAHLKWSPV